MTVERQPTLYKPKSKIRLALGLGGGAMAKPSPPRTVPPPITRPPLPVTSAITSTAKSTHLVVTTSASSSSTSATTTANELARSTSTTASTSFTSRPDSRSLFTYDTSPSTAHNTANHTRTRDLGFDTVSYASVSPRSTAFDPSPLPTPREQFAFPTPPASAEKADVSGDNIDPEKSLDDFPYLRAEVAASEDVYSISTDQLKQRFDFIKEIGFGNWGTVWKARVRHVDASQASMRGLHKVGRASAVSGGSGGGGVVAIKVVHRLKGREHCTPARVSALWGEVKVLRFLRDEPHPSIISFEAIIVTPHLVLAIMPYLMELISVDMHHDPRVRPYMRQLASAVSYLHERGITHNDIKPANIMISHSGTPVMIDFGFAHRFNVQDPEAFVTRISWGTPEYLCPHRAAGMKHDERASDVWSLGVTFFELLTGRTPFETGEEADEEREIVDLDDGVYRAYYERALDGTWLGDWKEKIDIDLEHLIRNMLHPQPRLRYTAAEVYHDNALILPEPEEIVTPHFLRAAASFDQTEEPVPTMEWDNHHAEIERVPAVAQGAGKHEKKKRTKKRSDASWSRATPLGESIKQHTAKKGVNGTTTPSPRKGSKLVIKKIRSVEGLDGDEEDPTPTKVLRPAQPLRVKEATQSDKKIALRPSHKDLRALRANSNASLRTAAQRDSGATARATENANASARSSGLSVKGDKENAAPARVLSHRASHLSVQSKQSGLTADANAPASAPATKEEAVLKTMRSLEGVRGAGAGGKKRDVLGAISRPAPEPPRPHSIDSVASASAAMAGPSEDQRDARRSLGAEKRLAALEEVAEEKTPERKTTFEINVKPPGPPPTTTAATTAVPAAVRTLSKATPPQQFGSPPRKRLAKPAIPTDDDNVDFNDSVPRLRFPSGVEQGVEQGASPLGDLRDRIMSTDNSSVELFKKMSGDLYPAQFTPSTTARPAAPGPAHVPAPAPAAESASGPSDAAPSLAYRKSVEALALDSRLDKISEWVKTVELIVQEARKALAEGREMPLPMLNLPGSEGIMAAVASGLPIPQLGDVVPVVPSQSLPGQSTDVAHGATAESEKEEARRRFGVSPDKAIPVHLRTSSTQVEPATPPKWMTYAEAEDQVRMANAWAEAGDVRRVPGKKERPSVVNVLKMFGAEKEKKDKSEYRSSTPEPNMRVPLKPPAPTLRATPSTPMLRSSLSGMSSLTGAQTTRMATRKSESNLRAFNTMPTNVAFADALRERRPSFDADVEDGCERFDSENDHEPSEDDTIRQQSPRRLYERFLDTTPGVVRQGEGWSSLSSGKALAKPSSMYSLRERARAVFGGDKTAGQVPVGHGHGQEPRQIVDLAGATGKTAATSGTERRNSKQLFGSERRPATPGAVSVLSGATAATGVKEGKEGKGWGRFKIKGWKGKKGDE